MEVRTRLNSKRNAVWLVECDGVKYVEKLFFDECCCRVEKQAYEKLQVLNEKLCPRVLSYKENTLIIEHLAGKTALKLLEEYEAQNNVDDAHKLLTKVMNWLKKFHSAFENDMIMGDANLSNFILSGDRVFGVDFEQSKLGDIHTDYFYTAAMYTQYDPVESDFKRAVIKKLYKNYFCGLGYEYKEYVKKIECEIEDIQLRRKQKEKLCP